MFIVNPLKKFKFLAYYFCLQICAKTIFAQSKQKKHWNSFNMLCSSVLIISLALPCLYSEFFRSVFSLMRTEYRDLICKSPHSVRMRENTDQENSEHEHFIRRIELVP